MSEKDPFLEALRACNSRAERMVVEELWRQHEASDKKGEIVYMLAPVITIVAGVALLLWLTDYTA